DAVAGVALLARAAVAVALAVSPLRVGATVGGAGRCHQHRERCQERLATHPHRAPHVPRTLTPAIVGPSTGTKAVSELELPSSSASSHANPPAARRPPATKS